MMSADQSQWPEKTCSVERLVTAPKEVEKVITGTKRATRRNGRYADIGEQMTLGGQVYTITRVYRQTLGDMTDAQAQQEGYPDLAAYRASILSFHPGMKWLPHMPVWVHEYEPVPTKQSTDSLQHPTSVGQPRE